MGQHERALPTLSIISATYNAARHLPRLIDSLTKQSDLDFEWVVADGGSTDGTLALLSEASLTFRTVVDSRPDFGIYDALNRGVRMATGDYYLVLGADDLLAPDAVRLFRLHAAATGADIVTARIRSNDRVVGVRAPKPWLYGQFAHVSAHAVGTIFRRNLHDRVGFYSRSFPIAADQLFIKKAIRAGAKVSVADFIAGEFCQDGTSGTDIFGSLSEGLRVQLATGEWAPGQLAIFAVRVIKNWRKIVGKHSG